MRPRGWTDTHEKAKVIGMQLVNENTAGGTPQVCEYEMGN